jgi:hypothetical protein
MLKAATFLAMQCNYCCLQKQQTGRLQTLQQCIDLTVACAKPYHLALQQMEVKTAKAAQ